VRRIPAIFFSALLVVVQSLPGIAMALPGSQVKAPCKCCGCGDSGCCVTKTAPVSQPLEAIPGVSFLQLTEFVFISSVVLGGLPSPTDLPVFHPFAERGIRAPAIPIFQRDCTFLI
jgi:hypothetical protein